MGHRPLRLFSPSLSISPDGRSLITVAAVSDVPRAWEQYQPITEEFQLKSGPVHETGLSGGWAKPEQYVSVDLETGLASPLVDAPAGRSLGYGYIAMDAFWLEDSRRVILSNTYLPLSDSLDEKTRVARVGHPCVALVGISSKELQDTIELRDAGFQKQSYHISGITWDGSKSELTVLYSAEGKVDVLVPAPQRYVLRSTHWIRLHEASERPLFAPSENIKLSVREDLNEPPRLSVERNDESIVLWDPNLQLQELQLGKVSVYRWQDTKGRAWSGTLALPPNLDSKRRYPLVIQTHGYYGEKFFADGWATTASGGRALVAKDMVVLQMDVFVRNFSTLEEGPDQVA